MTAQDNPAPVKAQAQDSLADQLQRVIALANEAGEYDAADWITRRVSDFVETWPNAR